MMRAVAGALGDGGLMSAGAWAAVIVALFVPFEAALLGAAAWLLKQSLSELRSLTTRVGSVEDYLWGPARGRGAAPTTRERPEA